jgi:uncharacterized membrane protein
MTATLPEAHSETGNRRGLRIEVPPAGTIKRSTTVMLPRDQVMVAWQAAGMPADATFSDAPGDKGTTLTVVIPDGAPTTALGSAFETLMKKNPADAVEKSLMQFKAKLETGEIPTTDGQPSGRR